MPVSLRLRKQTNPSSVRFYLPMGTLCQKLGGCIIEKYKKS